MADGTKGLLMRRIFFSAACWILLGAFGAFSADSEDPGAAPPDFSAIYSEAHRVKGADPRLALSLFRSVADQAPEPMAGRALLQMNIVYRMILMEPRLALKTLEEFESTTGSLQHAGYKVAHENLLSLKSNLGRVDDLETKLAALSADESSTEVLMQIANIYRNQLDSEKHGFDAYHRAWKASNEKYDVAYYMMGYCKHEMGELDAALKYFEDFESRFPESYLFTSAIDMRFRTRYLLVFHNSSPKAQKAEAAKLVKDIDKKLVDLKDLHPELRGNLENLKKLLENLD